jgi:hypothetical protein
LVKEGFGPYRFHKIDGFREIDFQGGTLEFYPSRRQRPEGLKGAFFEVAEKLGFYPPHSFHVVVRPKTGASFVYLASPQIDRVEWQLLMQCQPEFIIGSSMVSASEWLELSERTQRTILWAKTQGELGIQSVVPENSSARSKQWPTGGARNTLSS